MSCFYCKGQTIEQMTKFIVDLDRCVVIVKNVPGQVCQQCGETSYSDEVAQQLDLGGGFGVRYVESDPSLDIDAKVGRLAAAVREACDRLGMEMPEIRIEPGRSIVANAGMTLYTVGTVKRIPGYKNYVSVDGSMADHPRYALYGSQYTCMLAGKMGEPQTLACSVVGRCCESGDIIQEHVKLPASVCRGDILAVCTTGAYNHSMASCYNAVPRPPIVMIDGERDYVAVRRETAEDLEEFSKEYLNVLCGKVAGAMFQATQVSAHFGTPTFYHGRYEPEGQEAQFVLTYADEHSKGAHLIHHVACPQEDSAAGKEDLG